MNKSISTIVCLLAAACGAAPQPQDPETLAELDRARALLRDQQIDEALMITDKLLAANGDNRAALLVAAQGNVALFDSGRQGQQYFLEDAVSGYERALAIDETDADSWLQLADLYLKQAEFDDGAEAALRAAELLRDAKADPEKIGRAVLAAADNEMQAFVATRRDEIAAGEDKPQPGTLEQASGVLSRLGFVKQVLPGAGHAKSAQVYQWLGQDTNALAEYERGIEVAPDDQALHDGFQSLHAGMERRLECVAAYKRLLAAQPGSTLLLWHMARAQFGLADDHRAKGRPEPALAAYSDAAETFTRYRGMRPEHSGATDHWLAICNISRSKLALDTGDLEAAKAHNLAAWENTPRVAETDENGYPYILDSFNVHYLGLIDLIGRAVIAGSNMQALERGLAYYETIIERHPDQFGFAYNNAALAARDLGAAVDGRAERSADSEEERAAKKAEALALWERSYAHYEKAVALSPDDPRIVNDCGLMLIYHLFRKYDRARELFDRAIAIGQPQLDALAEDDAGQRQFLEEAVGDAYQNIGVLMRLQGKPFAEYESFLTKAVEYYPYRRRTAAALLRYEGREDVRIPGLPRPPGDRQTPQQAQQQSPRNELLDRVKKEAGAKADDGDYDGALLVLDAAAGKLGGEAEYHRLAGTYSLAYAKQAIRNGSQAALIDGLFADAIRGLQRSVELASEPIEPRLELARAYFDSGDFASAADESDSLLSHIRSLGGAMETHLAAAHGVRSQAHARVYIDAAQAGDAGEDNLRASRSSFERLEEKGELDEAGIQTWTTLERWAGSEDQALAILQRAYERTPDSLFLTDQLVEMAAAQDKLADALATLGAREDAAGRWYRGKAQFLAAQQSWRSGDAAAALDSLDRAIADFEGAQQQEASYAASCDEWLAYCFGNRGVIRLGRDDSRNAAKDLVRAAKSSPAHIANDLGNGYTIKSALLTLGGRFMEANDLARAEALFRYATEAAPDDPDFANNHGLFARDHGVALEHSGQREKAAEMYEASYASYTRAAQLQPDSVRLANDVALILIYHLDRDLDRAKTLLQEAAARGEQRLANDPPTDATELRDLQESVGDCYQNLGVYLERHAGDLQAAAANYRKSLTFHPHNMRESALHLRRVERKQKGTEAPTTTSAPTTSAPSKDGAR